MRMDLLADQASDLRSFLNNQGPSASSASAAGAAYSPGGPQHHPQSTQSPGSALGDNSAQQHHLHQQQHHTRHDRDSAKRKADDEDDALAKQQRSKRNRYVSIACNECKRRKIKCNGQAPCLRCGNLNLQCLYAPNCCSTNFKDSDDFKQVTEQVARLQEQVDTLFSSMTALRQETFRLAPIQERILPLPSNTVTPSPSTSSIRSLPKPPPSAPRVPPSFNGPTSINFTVDMAKDTLHKMGYSNLGDGQDDNGGIPDDPAVESPMLNPVGRAMSPSQQLPDPLWEFDKNEMVRLCRVHEEEVGVMYPVIKIETVIEHAKYLASWMESAKRNGLASPYGQDQGISDLKTCTLKIVMCCALVVEEHGCSAKATQLYESIRPIVDRKLMSEPADANTLPFLALVAGYRFLSNEEILAWRVMGQVARLCFELGLHRREGLAKIPDEQARRNALNTFWSAYVLDRRWSFGTGLPYVCHDDKIDPKLPLPESYPYLVAMISYSRLGAKIWKLVDYFEPALIRDLQRRDFEQLDREILDWYDTVPEEIKLQSLGNDVPMPSGPSYDTKRLQMWTRLRLNQIRIWLHTPVLHSASSIAENMSLATRTVELAKDTIRYLTHLNNTTNLYRRIQVFYHQFLTSAIAVLFLASTHAPLHFSAQCRTEFYMALELIKDMSARSWVSQRLWRTVQSLKAYAPRLGLQEEDPRPVAMAAGFGIQSPVPAAAAAPPSFSRQSSSIGTPVPGPARLHRTASSTTAQQYPSPVREDPNNGIRLHSEMSRIFEGYLGLGLDGRSTSAGPPLPARIVSPSSGSDGVDGVYQQVREMF